MKGSYLGPRFENDQIESDLISLGAIYTKVSENDLLDIIVEDNVNKKL